MKMILAGLLLLGSVSSFAGVQCNKLANQELTASQALAKYRYNTQLSKDINSNIKSLHGRLLDSADANFTNAVFDTK